MNKKQIKIMRYSILIFFLVLFSIFSLRHFILGGSVAASIDALCPFGGFETLYTFIATGGFVPRILMSSLILAVGVLLTAIVFRRGFCGWICPFGTIQELFGKLSKKKYELPHKFDKRMRYLKYIILILILIGTAYTGVLVFRDYDPFMTFFHFGKGIFWDFSADEFVEHMIPFGILVVMLGASIFIERFWCRYFCPLGATLSIFSKLGLTKIKRDRETCINCNLCNQVCPSKIKVSAKKVIDDKDCINCNKCVNVCPNQSLSLTMFKKKYSILTYVIGLIVLFFLVIGLSKSIGLWNSVPGTSLLDSSGNLNSANIKGWMTLNQVADETGININHFIIDLNLPKDINPDLPLKEIANTYNINFETEELRIYVDNFEHNPTHHLEEKEEDRESDEMDCPWNLENDPYPGRCSLYTDKDGNKICDYSA